MSSPDEDFEERLDRAIQCVTERELRTFLRRTLSIIYRNEDEGCGPPQLDEIIAAIPDATRHYIG
jgi:hypothetical protein